MQFVVGDSLEGLGPSAATILAGEEGKERMKEIGKICALDVLLNNWDRLPLIWQNDGLFCY